MSAQHTPGPWEVHLDRPDCKGVNVMFQINAATQFSLASGQSQEHLGEPHIMEAECIANARLMAAAPDLLQTLRDVLPHLDGGLIAAQVLVAIAKATGASS